MSRRRLLLLLPFAALVAVVGGTWVYLNVIRDDPPPRLTLATAEGGDAGSVGEGTTSTTAGSGSGSTTPTGVAGDWKVVSNGTTVGYRVSETLFGQRSEAVGRTSKVTGSLTITGTTVTKAAYSVDMASVTSSESQRDGQFRGRIMSVSSFPTATFELTTPIQLGSIPAPGKKIEVEASGKLTLRGQTRTVTFPLEAVLEEGRIRVLGTIGIDFGDYGIPNPSGGPASVGDEGDLEFLLVFERA